METKIVKAKLEKLNEILKLSLILNDTEPVKEGAIKSAIENERAWVAKDKTK